MKKQSLRVEGMRRRPSLWLAALIVGLLLASMACSAVGLLEESRQPAETAAVTASETEAMQGEAGGGIETQEPAAETTAPEETGAPEDGAAGETPTGETTEPPQAAAEATTEASAEATATTPEEGQMFLPNISGSEGGAEEGGEEEGGGQEPAAAASPAPADSARAGQELAYLKNNDIWTVAVPGGVPLQITHAGNVRSFTWAWDGEQLATFDGQQVCFVRPDGARAGPCVDLEMSEAQAAVERQLVWSPDGQTLVLWNPVNPGDEGALGWIIVSMQDETGEGTPQIQKIDDPVDWGLALSPNNEPGGITGQPQFLPDGTLIGTFTHRYLCGSGGCQYHLYRFDPSGPALVPIQPDNTGGEFSEGRSLDLAANLKALANYGLYHAGCDTFTTYADVQNLSTLERQSFQLEQQVVHSLSLAPDGSQAVIARITGGCETQDEAAWSAQCELLRGSDVAAMQVWDLGDGPDARTDLFPGLEPDWSPDGQWIAFRSCLAKSASASSGWEPAPEGPPNLYVVDPSGSGLTALDSGSAPQWRP